jgi:TetR/AcrR family transcriptional regulator, cholesterol catabolism regulator
MHQGNLGDSRPHSARADHDQIERLLIHPCVNSSIRPAGKTMIRAMRYAIVILPIGRITKMSRPRTGQRERIARAGGRLFRDKGYHGTSMADIGDAVGLRKASLYSHVATKQEMLRDLVERGAALFMEGIAPIAQSTDPAPIRLRQAMRMHLRVVGEHPDLAGVFLHEWRQLEGEALARVGDLRDRYERTWRSMIEDGIGEGRLRGDLDARFAALALLSAANWSYQWYDPHGPLSSDDVADRFTELALSGMEPRSTDRRGEVRPDQKRETASAMPGEPR